MENGAFAPKEQMLHFHNFFKYMIFRSPQKALLWSKGLTEAFVISTKIRILRTTFRFGCVADLWKFIRVPMLVTCFEIVVRTTGVAASVIFLRRTRSDWQKYG